MKNTYSMIFTQALKIAATEGGKSGRAHLNNLPVKLRNELLTAYDEIIEIYEKNKNGIKNSLDTTI